MDLSSLHPLEIKFLKHLQKGEEFSAETLILKNIMTPEHIRGVIGWLKARDWLIEVSCTTGNIAELTSEGEKYLKEGLPLRIIWNKLKKNYYTIADLVKETQLPQNIVGTIFGFLKKRKLIDEVEKKISIKNGVDDKYISILEKLVKKFEKRKINLSKINDEEQNILLENAKKRGSGSIFKIKEYKSYIYRLNKTGEDIRNEMKKINITSEIGKITVDILKEKSWVGKDFRKFNISLSPKPQLTGRSHPYARFLKNVRQTITNMGFVEMKGPIVVSEFYNNDLLYMPQFHPARDIHDIYYTKEPKKEYFDEKTVDDKIKEIASVHRDGGRTESKGWGYEFSIERTKQLVLRSQGTAISAQVLSDKPMIPGKYFAIARCFRYDHVDATHAPDFFQIEGIVIEEEINFRHLLGLLSTFAKKLAKTDNLKFVPSYFPFTEPSVEAHIKHPELGWIELGGAGIFRPEITKPLKIHCPVIAWGLGLDRMAMNSLGINDIRELFTNDLEKIRWAVN